MTHIGQELTFGRVRCFRLIRHFLRSQQSPAEGKIRPGKFLLRLHKAQLEPLPFRYVMYHTHRTDNLSRLVPEMSAPFLNEKNFTSVPFHYSVLDFVAVIIPGKREPVGGVDPFPVVGVHRFQKGIIGGNGFSSGQAEKDIHLVTPGQPHGCQFEFPASEAGNLLGFAEQAFALSQGPRPFSDEQLQLLPPACKDGGENGHGSRQKQACQQNAPSCPAGIEFLEGRPLVSRDEQRFAEDEQREYYCPGIPEAVFLPPAA
ncbi:hypothetical protein SDC9_76896 [bioreactor metagenome]|uniref:Uncharacterized protein n=1 Tax=bioreactor metagenome TaxID=1076179 RepID=A0A644YQS0_9ZZZZ